ncbi:MAG: hypothetical protein FWD81_02035 [Methanomassiliicoccaceae archaeon]|nr:hypothetical protein [Methanomassiliicoccaceae archaeon]
MEVIEIEEKRCGEKVRRIPDEEGGGESSNGKRGRCERGAGGTRRA